MKSFQVSRDLIFADSDYSRPRMAVESEKLKRHFPAISLYATDNTITSAQGYLHTAEGNWHYIRVDIPSDYPYTLPKLSLPMETIDSSCPHKYESGNICVMKPEQWSS